MRFKYLMANLSLVFCVIFALPQFSVAAEKKEVKLTAEQLRAQSDYIQQRKLCETKNYDECFAAADSLMLLQRGEEALRIYHKLCVDQLHERACNMAVYMMSEGLSIPPNVPKALELGEYMCTKQVYQGCLVAGDLYAADESNAQNYFHAKELLTIACKKGQLIQACYNLGKLNKMNGIY